MARREGLGDTIYWSIVILKRLLLQHTILGSRISSNLGLGDGQVRIVIGFDGMLWGRGKKDTG
mgnify:CR=1 FL=1|jgi:hypothetical protein